MTLPKVSILLPVLNEAGSIDACLESIESQDYAGTWDLIVVDGGSTDGTLEKLERWMHRIPLEVVENPERRQSIGLGLASSKADGEILLRMDAHTTYAANYVTRSVQTLHETEADAVGGPMIPAPGSGFAGAIARVMTSPLGIGPAPFHRGGARREVDTVYLGAFRRETFLRLNGMRALPSGVAEDADFYWRLREEGGRVIMDPSIVSEYTPRRTPGALARQFWRYGLGKADMLYVNGRWPSWRPWAPLLLVVGLITGIVLGLVDSWWPLTVLVAAWVGALAVAGRGRPLDALAAAIMHLSYGLGLLRGLFRSPASVRAAVR